MATIAIRKSAWDAASARDRTIFRYAAKLLELGDPAVYVNGGGVEWYISDDHRLRLKDVARLGVVVKGIAQNTTYELPLNGRGELDVEQLRADMKAWVTSRIVWPVDVEGSPNPWQAVLDAQGAPAVIRAGDSVPDTWTPV